jgi:hypothetical protein
MYNVPVVNNNYFRTIVWRYNMLIANKGYLQTIVWRNVSRNGGLV